MVAIIGNVAMLTVVGACSNADYRRQVNVVGTKGKFFISKTGTAIPLTDDNDTVEYQFGSKKLRVFAGTGGKTLSLAFDRARDLLIISYCGGRIESVESSFTDVLSTEGEGWKIYRTQVVNNPGFTYGKAPLCS